MTFIPFYYIKRLFCQLWMIMGTNTNEGKHPIMKVNTLSAMTEKGLEKKVNAFLDENHQLEILDITR